MARGGAEVRRLWEVCQVPDFRKVSPSEHAALAAGIYRFLLSERGVIPSDWMARRIRQVDRIEGDIDALSKRLAYIRTWTYVAQRRDWVEDPEEWRAAAREVEDRLSDALHLRLTQRFVDRRTSVLMRRLKQKERLVAEVNEQGEVTAEGHVLGRLDGFRFTPDPDATGEAARTLRAASTEALKAEFQRRSDRFYNAPDTEIDLTEQGGLMWGDLAVGKLVKGPDRLQPGIEPFVDEIAGEDARLKVERRLTHWINRRIAAQFEPLIKLRDDEAVTGLARGVAFSLVEALGVVPRQEIAKDVKELDQEGRALLRKHGVRFGQYTVFMPALLKPAPTRLRIALWALDEGLDEWPSPPPPGLVTIPADDGEPAGFWPRAGYRLAGPRAIRIDMLERLADLLRGQDQRGGFEATADMLSITGCTLDQFAELMKGLGYRAERGERPKAPQTPPEAAPQPPEAAEAAPAADPTPEPAPDIEAPAETGAAEGATPAAPADEAEAASPAAETPSEPEPEAPAPAAPAAEEEAQPSPAADSPAKVEPLSVAPAAPEEAPEAPKAEASEAAGEPETQVFYTFAWVPRPRGGRGPKRESQGRPGGKPAGKRGKPGGPKGKGKGGPREEKPREFAAGPPRDKRRKEKEVDPDSPFAALAALKKKD
jgi:ATP-dependent RNA helicase SUPV3L1/SUV3